jgi:hypothetical protein
MAESSQQPLPTPAGLPAEVPSPAPAWSSRALLVTLAIAAGAAATGVVGGLIWSAVAPQAVFVVQSPGVAYVVNPETSAFIAADGSYSLIALVGGAVIGLAGWTAGVRRFGPLPAAGALAGATAAGFLAWWVGSNIGLAAFRHHLGSARPGALLRQPPDLGAHGALAFWPLAAGVVIGGIELMFALHERQREPDARPAFPWQRQAAPDGQYRADPAADGVTPGGQDGPPTAQVTQFQNGQPPEPAAPAQAPPPAQEQSQDGQVTGPPAQPPGQDSPVGQESASQESPASQELPASQEPPGQHDR